MAHWEKKVKVKTFTLTGITKHVNFNYCHVIYKFTGWDCQKAKNKHNYGKDNGIVMIWNCNNSFLTLHMKIA